MIDLISVTYLKNLMLKYNVKFSKILGQNFLINDNICENIADFAQIDKHTNVIEIGPGAGALTEKLASRARKVLAIEIDSTLLPILDETLQKYHNVSILTGDILKFNITKLIEENFPEGGISICSNLPYCITSPVILKLLIGNKYEDSDYSVFRSRIKSVTFLLQQEAAVRLCAKPPSREVGSISYLVSYFSNPKMGFRVTKGNFIPSPKVDSQVVRFDILNEPFLDVKDESLFFRVIRAAFQQRRKNICNSLSSALPLDKKTITEVLESINILPNMRAEELSLEQFAQIANNILLLKKV